jgi:hypothetical protein
MELQYFGANAIKISTKKASIVVDDNLAALGLKTIVSEKDIALYTSKLIEPTKNAHFVINLPGEYEVSDASMYPMLLSKVLQPRRTWIRTKAGRRLCIG